MVTQKPQQGHVGSAEWGQSFQLWARQEGDLEQAQLCQAAKRDAIRVFF